MLNKTNLYALRKCCIYRYFNPYLYDACVSDKYINDNNVNEQYGKLQISSMRFLSFPLPVTTKL